ncbi:carboxymuconolactone decarboxylase family protein [Actinacidiphila paucisporea]|uniref:Alkylhydroperoxidase AhpD family core domain-containing protein n=1 Tax=Actinacidiphila paucisporea TaxID=310782 RepID=A0A1M7F8F3_9ACTN|nr:carboxymuconolactone decarboxylase family protein [Actinacidiphila paucisporea]SHM00048.1 alkylhydroperoxidase AhpD family core domain-containing protein [Actinacidiphila paucisporea]
MSTETATAVKAATTEGDLVVPAVRLAVDTLVPHVNRAMNALDAAARDISLEVPLLELVRARASQLNGCAYCVDTHSKDAREGGESERRLYALPVWRETPFFTARERAALELTEAVTRLADGQVGDEVFARAAARFSDQELAELIWAITVINAWNRLGATARPWPLS